MVKLAVITGLLVLLNHLVGILLDTLSFEIRPSNEDMVHRTILIAASLYTLLLATPFVPGVEIGIAMIVLFGPPIVLLIYLCTVAGLVVAFLAGRLIPIEWMIRLAGDLHMKRLADLLRKLAELDGSERLQHLAGRAPNNWVPVLVRYRYLALALAINIPGNFLIGGGGGIALFAGFSRLYSLPLFLISVMIAVAPVPLAVLAFGTGFLER